MTAAHDPATVEAVVRRHANCTPVNPGVEHAPSPVRYNCGIEVPRRVGAPARVDEHHLAAVLALFLAAETAEAERRGAREVADSLGVYVGDESGEWWDGYRAGQRRSLMQAQETARELAGNHTEGKG